MSYYEDSSYILYILLAFLFISIFGAIVYFVFGKKNTIPINTASVFGQTGSGIQSVSSKVVIQPQVGVAQPNTIQLVSQQMASQQAASQQIVSQQMAAQQAASQQMAAQQAASQQMASQQMASQQMASQQMVSQQMVSQQKASQQMASQQKASLDAASNKNIIVAYGDGGIAYTTNGINWQWCFKEIAGKGGCQGMTYGNGKYLAIFGGYTASSIDGINWTQGFSNHPGRIMVGQGVAAGNGLWISIGYMNNLSSVDGVTWNSINDIIVSTNYTPGGEPQCIIYANGMFQVGSNIYDKQGALIYYTKDAKNWTITLKQNSDVTTGISKIAYGNGIWVAIGNPVSGTQTNIPIWYSNDGINWNLVKASPGSVGIPGAPWFWGLAFGNGIFFALGIMPLFSKDGANWQPMANWPKYNLESMMYQPLKDFKWISNTSSPTGGYWLTCGSQNHGGAYVLGYSADGCVWTGSPDAITGPSIYDNAGYKLFHSGNGFCN